MTREADKIYGIDLGTTNSCISVLENGRPRVIPVDGDGVVPSVVSLDGGELLVGRRALNRVAAYPEQSCRSIKRLMGTDEKVVLGKRTYRPEEISSVILEYLVAEAKRLEGLVVKRAVITVPAYFSDAQRRATREAGHLAGLEVERLLNEPTAAALFYDLINVGRGEEPGDPPRDGALWRHALVYDLGGGTFDVSVLRLGEIIEVVASTGDTRLGGDDFDEIIARNLALVISANGGPDVTGHPTAMVRLRLAAEKAKKALSELGTVMIEEAVLPTGRGDETTSLTAELTRTNLEGMTADLVAKTMDLVRDALRESHLDASEIDRVIMVGGMTRMPIITYELSKVFGRAQMPAVDPDLGVANGAAVQGGIISGENADQILIDVAAHTLSLSSLDENERLICCPIIPRNTSIPAKRSRVFYTHHHNQKAVVLSIYQGEGLKPSENKLIGSKRLNLAPAEAQSPIEVEYSYDLSGIIHVVAVQRGYGRKVELDIDSRDAHLELEEIDDDDLDDYGDGEGGPRRRGIEMGYGPGEAEDEEGDGDDWDEDQDDEDEAGGFGGRRREAAPSGQPLNLLVRRAESIISNLPESERGPLSKALEDYRQALLDGDEEMVDGLEDKLLDLMEKRS